MITKSFHNYRCLAKTSLTIHMWTYKSQMGIFEVVLVSRNGLIALIELRFRKFLYHDLKEHKRSVVEGFCFKSLLQMRS